MILREIAHGLGRLYGRFRDDAEGHSMTLQIKAGRYIGQILVDGGFLSLRDIELALEEQRNTNELLGQVLTRMGILDSADLRAALSVQEHLVRLEDAVKTAAGVRKTLGALLLQAGSISEEQLEQALAEQRKSGEKLGEVFVRLGFLTARQLDALLEFQHGQERAGQACGPLRLGDILVSSGQISREQLEHALRRQAATSKKLGEVLIEEGYAQPRQVSHGIQLQQKLLTAVLVAILSLASLPGAEAEAASASSAQLRVSATVLPYTTMDVRNRAQMVTVTESDIARGYVDIVGGSSIEVKSNSRDGYYLSFECFDPTFRQVRIDGLGRPATIGAGSAIVPMAMDGRQVRLEVSYRFVLSDDMTPGVYPWPLTVSVMPM